MGVLRAVADHCPVLETLRMAKLHEVLDEDCQHWATTRAHLKELDIGRCIELGDEGVRHLLQEPAALHSLNLHSVDKVTSQTLDLLTAHAEFARFESLVHPRAS